MQKSQVIDRLVEIYRNFEKYPTVISAHFLRGESSTIRIKSNWSQRNLVKKELTKFSKFHLLTSSGKDIYNFPPVDTSAEQLSRVSTTEKFHCVIRETFKEPPCASKKKQFLEIWQSDYLCKSFDVEEYDVHGSIYCDGEFGSLEWSPDDSKILYIAEEKAVPSRPFFKQKPVDPKQSEGEFSVVGEEYAYKQDWGEQLVGKYQPVVGICDIKQETLQVLKGIPSNFSPGQVIWTKDGDGVYGIVLENEPRKLGLIYCTNRLGYVFHLTLKGEFTILSEQNRSVRSPRLSPDGKYLFWLQRMAGGPHHACQELIRFDTTTRKREIIVPIVRMPGEFSGIFSHELPRRCFSNDGKYLFFSTANKTRNMSYSINLDTKEVSPIKTNESSAVLDVYNDMLLVAVSSLQSSPSIIFSASLKNIEWVAVTKSEELLKGSVVKHMQFDLKDSKDDCKYFSGLYFGPEPVKDKNIPLILYPHGGPHSCSLDLFSIECSFFVSIGFGVFFVNYRGSTGAGEDGVQFLPGKIGDTDVKDNYYAVEQLIKELPYIDSKRLVLFGGSHGGFLVTHLSAQYPDAFKAVVARNPVIDVFSMYSTTDIPDWDVVESGFTFNEAVPLTIQQASKMLQVSPIFRADKIKAPTFFMIGKKDLRVPFSQGLYLYSVLKARKVKTRINVYDDNHPLGLVPVHLDTCISAALWFMEHIGMTL
ncbi:UNVERIFIED_CONTAM: hypothetical protein PYX00_005534 [Menopon gallinae]|uniref:Acylamino-acid-releasing enzyme n=1 Tax=Menopon gallinae TaxID=328185 RepID=A0AAW2HS72_9NEOP